LEQNTYKASQACASTILEFGEAILKGRVPKLLIMRFDINLGYLCLALAGVRAQAVQDQCPKNEIACLDIINSSQCIEQLVVEKQAPLTKDAMIKCVEYEGTASNLPGAAKVSQP
jgi:hypothetical protein